jgi:hypothetical protein
VGPGSAKVHIFLVKNTGSIGSSPLRCGTANGRLGFARPWSDRSNTIIGDRNTLHCNRVHIIPMMWGSPTPSGDGYGCVYQLAEIGLSRDGASLGSSKGLESPGRTRSGTGQHE